MDVWNIMNHLHYEQVALKEKYEQLVSLVGEILKAIKHEEIKNGNQRRNNQDADTRTEASVEKDKVAITFTLVRFVPNSVTLDHAYQEKGVTEDILKDANIGPEDIVGEEAPVFIFTFQKTWVQQRKKQDMKRKIEWRTKLLIKMKNLSLRKIQVKMSLMKKTNLPGTKTRIGWRKKHSTKTLRLRMSRMRISLVVYLQMKSLRCMKMLRSVLMK